jgi:hypothetical protein
MEGTECSRSATTAASHRPQGDREGVQGTQYPPFRAPPGLCPPGQTARARRPIAALCNHYTHRLACRSFCSSSQPLSDTSPRMSTTVSRGIQARRLMLICFSTLQVRPAVWYVLHTYAWTYTDLLQHIARATSRVDLKPVWHPRASEPNMAPARI